MIVELLKIIKKAMRTPGRIPMNIIYRIPVLANHIPDDIYLKFIHWCCFGKKLNLDNPQTFNEKLQWLKLYDRNPIYTQLVDKYEVRKYIANTIGGEYLVPLLGIWDNFDQIDFEKLPNQFVLKCTHDSGGLVICRDKGKLDIYKARKKINKSLKRNFYLAGREWPYKDVKPRIIAEKYMEDESVAILNSQSEQLMPAGLTDYKFYCFDGRPEYLYVSKGLENHSTARVSFYDMNFIEGPFGRKDFASYDTKPPKPLNFEKMKQLAVKLSKGYTFLRVDLYEINGKIYFSELTFHPCSGLMPFNPEKYDYELGKMLSLPEKRNALVVG
jgi:hypothetical protein